MKTTQNQGDRRHRPRKRHAGGRSLLHGVKLEPFAFRMPPEMREAITRLGDAASVSDDPDDKRTVSDNSVLLVAVSEWLARNQSPLRVRRVALALDFRSQAAKTPKP